MKQKIKRLAHQLWTDESGQGTLEYALIVVAIVGLALVFRDEIQARLKGFMGVGGKLEGALESMGSMGGGST